MLEIVMLVEQTLQVSIDNEELRDLRTVGGVKAYLSAKAKGEKPPTRSKTYRIEGDCLTDAASSAFSLS